MVKSGSPWRDETGAALERVAHLEEENARLRAELVRRSELASSAARPPRRRRADRSLVATMFGFGALGGVGVAFAALGLGRHVAREAHEPVAVEPQVEASGPSYESALATIGEGARAGRSLDALELAAPLTPLAAACARPHGMRANVRVAVVRGRAVGVSVYTTPRDPMVATCIDREIRRISWPDAPALSTLVTGL